MEMLGSVISRHISRGVYIAASVDICHLVYPRILHRLCHPTGKMGTIYKTIPSIHSWYDFIAVWQQSPKKNSKFWGSVSWQVC